MLPFAFSFYVSVLKMAVVLAKALKYKGNKPLILHVKVASMENGKTFTIQDKSATCLLEIEDLKAGYRKYLSTGNFVKIASPLLKEKEGKFIANGKTIVFSGPEIADLQSIEVTPDVISYIDFSGFENLKAGTKVILVFLFMSFRSTK